MKKLNNKGFILAETLIVSVFLMVLFTMIYSNFYPLIGEYEKRENYDDVDGKYTAYWIKKMVESNDYSLIDEDINMLNRLGYTRFKCSNMTSKEKKEMCMSLVNSLQISRCDTKGDDCDIYITRYTINNSDGDESKLPPSVKKGVRGNLTGQEGDLTGINEINARNGNSPFSGSNVGAMSSFMSRCCDDFGLSTLSCSITNASQLAQDFIDYDDLYSYSGSQTTEAKTIVKACHQKIVRKAFLSATKDYILSLPNYTLMHSSTGAKFRVIVVAYHTKDRNRYYSFSTMEVVR